MKMAVEMAAVSMEKPSGGTSRSDGVPEQRLLSPDLGLAMAARKVLWFSQALSNSLDHCIEVHGRDEPHSYRYSPSLDGELLPPHGSSSGDEDGGGDGSGVDGEAFRGTSPSGGVRNETLSPDLGLAMAAGRFLWFRQVLSKF
ncbi:hypothetical protein QYE76_056177 [Lolium multiflorum]|uniref:Uncharacterized protein n=1 Tax=Lolium multiflorum TaxID=4521 RepID=A0AAD8WPL3_LOLMU|nr:hypothetical protein QYE76_056177 [Lolium multiflorum]